MDHGPRTRRWLLPLRSVDMCLKKPVEISPRLPKDPGRECLDTPYQTEPLPAGYGSEGGEGGVGGSRGGPPADPASLTSSRVLAARNSGTSRGWDTFSASPPADPAAYWTASPRSYWQEVLGGGCSSWRPLVQTPPLSTSLLPAQFGVSEKVGGRTTWIKQHEADPTGRQGNRPDPPV